MMSEALAVRELNDAVRYTTPSLTSALSERAVRDEAVRAAAVRVRRWTDQIGRGTRD